MDPQKHGETSKNACLSKYQKEPNCFFCQDVFQMDDDYLADLDMTRPARYEEQMRRLGLVRHVANIEIYIEEQILEFTMSAVKLENEDCTSNRGEKTSLELQTLATMVPDTSEAVSVRIQDGVEDLLALARQPNSWELPSRGPIEETPGQTRKSVIAKHQRVPLHMRNHLNQVKEIDAIVKMTAFDDLPEEVLLEVMSHLNLGDRKITRMVSKKLHRISYHRKLIENDWTTINATENLNHTSPNSRHLNVRVRQYDLTETLPFWVKHGGEVEELNFQYFISVGDEALPNLLRCCPNVKRVVITFKEPETSCKNLAFPVVPLLHLESLEVEEEYIRSETWMDLILALFAQTPKLKELNISIPSEPLASRKVLEFIKRHSNTLEGLDLLIPPKKEEYFTQVVASVGTQLKKLSLKCVGPGFLIIDSILHEIVRKFVNLENLCLGSCEVQDSALEHAISSLKTLSELTLFDVRLTHNSALIFVAINNCKNLTTLDLTWTPVTAEILTVAFSSPHEQLTNLYLDTNGHDNQIHDFPNQILQNFPNLLSLRLNRFRLKDKHMKGIAQHNTQLKDLSLTGPYVRLSSSINEIKSLVHLSMAGSKCIDAVRALSLPKLHSIYLTGTEITLVDIIKLMERNPSLHRLVPGHKLDLAMTDQIRGKLQRRTHPGSC